jgi:hypothetical protein
MPTTLQFLSIIVLILAAFGCGDPTRPGLPRDFELQVVGGLEQTGPAGQELPEPIVVRVTTPDGQAAAGVLINFVVTAGGGHVFAGSALTNENGEARERWTLGTVAGDNVLEARSVDQTTGEAIVHAQIHATAIVPTGQPNAVFVPLEYRSQYRLVGQLLDVRDFVSVTDTWGFQITDAPLTLSAGPGLVVSGTTVQADPLSGREASGVVTVSVGELSDSFQIAFLPDLTGLRWRATYSCYSPVMGKGGVDSLVNVVALSDSVRQDAFQLSADQWYGTLDVMIYMQATATVYYTDGRVVDGPIPDWITKNITAQLFPQGIAYGRLRDGYRPAHGVMVYTNAFSDGTVPPTYHGGHLCDDRFDRYTPGLLEPVQ